MSIPCGCEENNIYPEHEPDGYQPPETDSGEKLPEGLGPVEIKPEEHCGGMGKCPALVHDTVCVQAEVTINPYVNVGKIESYCLGKPVIGACSGKMPPAKCCSFTVSQNIRVQVPLTFSAYAKAMPTGIVCGMPGIGKCEKTGEI